MTIPLQFASPYDGQGDSVWSDCLLVGNMLVTCVCMRCVVSCRSTSFPWLVFFFGTLLWGSMMWQGSAPVVSWSWEKYSCHSKLVSALSTLLLLMKDHAKIWLKVVSKEEWSQVGCSFAFNMKSYCPDIWCPVNSKSRMRMKLKASKLQVEVWFATQELWNTSYLKRIRKKISCPT